MRPREKKSLPRRVSRRKSGVGISPAEAAAEPRSARTLVMLLRVICRASKQPCLDRGNSCLTYVCWLRSEAGKIGPMAVAELAYYRSSCRSPMRRRHAVGDRAWPKECAAPAGTRAEKCAGASSRRTGGAWPYERSVRCRLRTLQIRQGRRRG